MWCLNASWGQLIMEAINNIPFLFKSQVIVLKMLFVIILLKPLFIQVFNANANCKINFGVQDWKFCI
jgi:hypothetical protein